MDKADQKYCFAQVLENLPNGIIITDFDGNIILCNSSFSDIFGYTKHAFKSIKDLVAIADSRTRDKNKTIQQLKYSLEKIYTKKEVTSTTNLALQCKNGSLKDIKLHLSVTEQFVVLSIIDITNENTLLKKVAESEEKYRILYENSNDAIFLLRDWNIFFFNKKALEIFACTKEDIQGKTPIDFSPVYQPDGEKSLDKGEKLFESMQYNDSIVFEWQHIKKTKEVFDAEIALNTFNLSGEKIHQVVIRDITEKKTALRKLEESRKKYIEIVEHANSAIIKLDTEGNITFFNEYAEKTFLYNRCKVVGQNLVGTIIVPNEENGFLKDISKDSIKQIISNIEYYSYWESWNINSKGKSIYMSWTNKPLKDKDQNIVGVVSIGTNITPMKKAFDKLRENEQKYRTLFNSVNDSIILIDTEGNLIEANERVEDKLGININSLKGKPFYEILPNSKKGDFIKAVKEVVLNGQGVFEFNIRNQEGKLFPAEVKAQLIKYEGRDAIITINRDISKRKKEQLEIFNAIVDTEEEERSRVARELHDGVSPILSTAKLYAQSLKNCPEEMKTMVFTKVETTIDEAIKSVSEISNNLSPHILQNFGLIIAVKSFSEKVSEVNNISILVKSNFDKRLPEKLEITLFRVAVELINNSIKHSEATEVELNFVKNKLFILQYRDNGIGFNFKTRIKLSKQMGLFNMLNRIQSINGNIFHDSKETKGTKLTISIPLNNEQYY